MYQGCYIFERNRRKFLTKSAKSNAFASRKGGGSVFLLPKTSGPDLLISRCKSFRLLNETFLTSVRFSFVAPLVRIQDILDFLLKTSSPIHGTKQTDLEERRLGYVEGGGG